MNLSSNTPSILLANQFNQPPSSQFLLKQFQQQSFLPIQSQLNQQQAQSIKQKNDATLDRSTSQLFQDASNLPHTQFVLMGNRSGTPNSQNQGLGVKWSPKKTMKILAEDEYQQNSHMNPQKATPDKIKIQPNSIKGSKENTIQPIIMQNNTQINSTKVGYHSKNFQSCGGINLNYLHPNNNQIDSDQLVSPTQNSKNSNSRMISTAQSTNNFILNRKESLHKYSHSPSTHTTAANINQNNTTNNINNKSNLQTINIVANNPFNNLNSPANQNIITNVAQSTRATKTNHFLQQQQTHFSQLSQSHRNNQIQSKSICNLQQIGFKLGSQNAPNTNSTSLERTRSLTPNHLNQQEAGFNLNYNLIEKKQNVQKKPLSHFPISMIEEENIQNEYPEKLNKPNANFFKIPENNIQQEDQSNSKKALSTPLTVSNIPSLQNINFNQIQNININQKLNSLHQSSNSYSASPINNINQQNNQIQFIASPQQQQQQFQQQPGSYQIINRQKEEVFDSYGMHQKTYSIHDFRNNNNNNNTTQGQMNNNTKIFHNNQTINHIQSQSNINNQISQIKITADQPMFKTNFKSTVSSRNSHPSLLQNVISPSNKQQINLLGAFNENIQQANSFQINHNNAPESGNISIKTLLNSQISGIQNVNNNNNNNNDQSNLNNNSIIPPNNINSNTSNLNLGNITPIISVNSNKQNLANASNSSNHQFNNNSKSISNINNSSNIFNNQNNNTFNNINNTTITNINNHTFNNFNNNSKILSNYGLQQPLPSSQKQSSSQQIFHHQSSKSLQNISNLTASARLLNNNTTTVNPQNQINNYYNINSQEQIMYSPIMASQNSHSPIQKRASIEIQGISSPPTPHISSFNYQQASPIPLQNQKNGLSSQINNEIQYSKGQDLEGQNKSSQHEKLNTENFEQNIQSQMESLKHLKTETSQQMSLINFHTQQTPSLQNQQKTESSDSFQYYQNKRRYQVKDFELIKQLGQGVFGQVYMVSDKKTKGIYALKLIDKQMIQEKEMEQQLQRELNIHSQYSNHVNVLECLGYFDDDKNYYLLLEYASDGTCANLIESLPMRRLTEQLSCNLIKQLLEAINYLHSNRVIHRDLKLENVLISNGKVKLCDFGCATFSDNPVYQRRRSFCGTLDYVSPEMIQNQIYDKEIDIWALGVIAFELCSGFAPFTQYNEQQTYQAIQNVKLIWPKNFSEELKDFLKKIFIVDPRKRPTASQLLNHEWIQKFNSSNEKNA